MTNQPNSDSSQELHQTKEKITNSNQINSDSLQAETSPVNTEITTEENVSATHKNTKTVSRVPRTLDDTRLRLSQSWLIIIGLIGHYL